MADYVNLWEKLGIDLDAHERLLQALPPTYRDVYLSQNFRPQGMEYFDFVINEIHGLRIQELQEHKQRGGMVVGAFCVYVPEEIILAAGGECIGLCAGLEIDSGITEKYLPQNICPLIKSFMGFKLARICPYFESCNVVVGETTCDGKKKAFEALSNFVPVYLMETPQMKREKDMLFWREEVEVFYRYLENLAGRPITVEDLKQGVRKTNNKRKALMRLSELRKNDPAPISGRDALLIEQIAMYDNVERITTKINELCVNIEAGSVNGKGAFPAGTPRLILSGTPMPVPFWKVPYLVETSGAVIVAEEMCTGLRYFEHLVTEEGAGSAEILNRIADRYLKIDCAVFTPNSGRLDKIIQLVKDYRAEGVILCTLTFCDPYLIEALKIEKELKEKGIPVLRLETDYGQGDINQLKTRIGAFVEMISS